MYVQETPRLAQIIKHDIDKLNDNKQQVSQGYILIFFPYISEEGDKKRYEKCLGKLERKMNQWRSKANFKMFCVPNDRSIEPTWIV